jgi:hypothetical protein
MSDGTGRRFVRVGKSLLVIQKVVDPPDSVHVTVRVSVCHVAIVRRCPSCPGFSEWGRKARALSLNCLVD